MLILSKSMVKSWCKVDGQPGFLLISGAKVKQSAVKFEELTCQDCGKDSPQFEEPRRMEAYIRRFQVCLGCHARKLFPDNQEKQDAFYLTMACKSSVGCLGRRYHVDYMMRTCTKEVQ